MLPAFKRIIYEQFWETQDRSFRFYQKETAMKYEECREIQVSLNEVSNWKEMLTQEVQGRGVDMF